MYQLAKRRYASILKRTNQKDLMIPLEAFLGFYGEDTQSIARHCEYCGINETEIHQLIQHGLLITKRLKTRGRSMEVDRKDPEGPYAAHNIVLCCYWCNNAKTDEFSFEEFKEIAKSFTQIWQQRLQKFETKIRQAV